MRIRVTALAVTIFGLMAMCSSASAVSTRYASPTGVSSGSDCTVSQPKCEISYAINSQAGSSDTVILTRGTSSYSLSTTLVVNKPNLTIIGEAGIGQVDIPYSGKILQITVSGVALINFSLSGTGISTNYALELTSGATNTQIRNLKAQNYNTNSNAAPAFFTAGGSTISDSLFLSASSTTAPLGTGSGSVTNLNNVTAMGTGANGAGMGVGGTVNAHNSVFYGGAAGTATDIISFGGSLTSDYSNYSRVSGGLTLSRGAGDQTSNPQLGFNGMPQFSSPLIDAGSAGNLLYTPQAAIDGTGRFLGSAPDIGAYETGKTACGQIICIDTTKPVISGLKAKKKKGKLKTFDFFSTEAGTATLTFTRKKGKRFKRAGSQTKAVKAGKNSIKPKKLKKGKYRLSLTVKDAAGNASVAKKLSFKVK